MISSLPAQALDGLSVSPIRIRPDRVLTINVHQAAGEAAWPRAFSRHRCRVGAFAAPVGSFQICFENGSERNVVVVTVRRGTVGAEPRAVTAAAALLGKMGLQ